LDDDFAVRGFPVDSCRQFVSYQIGQYLANGPERNGAAAPADQRPIEFNIAVGV